MLIQQLGEMNEIRTMKVGDFWRRKDMFEQFGNDRSVKAEIWGRRWFCCRSNWSLRRCFNLWLTVWPSSLGISAQSIIACHGHVTVYWMFIGCAASSGANCCIVVRWLSTFTNVYHDSPHGGCIITARNRWNSCSNVFMCFIKYT